LKYHFETRTLELLGDEDTRAHGPKMAPNWPQVLGTSNAECGGVLVIKYMH